MINDFGIEYDLERCRYERYRDLPSRLFALFLFESRTEASRYYAQHPTHVGRRILKRGLTTGSCIYSIHDSARIDFLRLGHSMDADTFNYCWRGYWSGARINAPGVAEPHAGPPQMRLSRSSRRARQDIELSGISQRETVMNAFELRQITPRNRP